MDIAYISYQLILVDNPYYLTWGDAPSFVAEINLKIYNSPILKIMPAKSNISCRAKYSWIEKWQSDTHHQATIAATYPKNRKKPELGYIVLNRRKQGKDYQGIKTNSDATFKIEVDKGRYDPSHPISNSNYHRRCTD